MVYGDRKCTKYNATLKEESLKNDAELNGLYHRVFTNINEAMMVTDKKGHIVTVNPAFTKITGYSREEVIGENPRLLSSGYHDKDFYKNMWADIREHGSWRGEIYNRRKSGEFYIEQLSVHVVRDDMGQVTNYVGTFSDLTDHKSQKDRLDLYARTFEHSTNCVMITDKKGVLISVNPSFSKTTGYSQEEVIGERPSLLHSGRQSQTFYKHMWSQINEKGCWQGELWNRRKDGTIYLEWLSINTIRDHKGKVTNYIGVFADITSKRESE